MNDLYYFKSILGEWILGKLVEDNDDGFVLEKPRMIVMAPGRNQNEMVTHYMPYDMLNPDASVRFNPDFVGAQVIELSQQLVDGYVRATTDIEIAHSIQ